MRGLYLFQYSHFANFDLAIGADIGEYAARASEIMKGKFFPDSPEIHAPLYSFFLAGIQKNRLQRCRNPYSSNAAQLFCLDRSLLSFVEKKCS